MGMGVGERGEMGGEGGQGIGLLVCWIDESHAAAASSSANSPLSPTSAHHPSHQIWISASNSNSTESLASFPSTN